MAFAVFGECRAKFYDVNYNTIYGKDSVYTYTDKCLYNTIIDDFKVADPDGRTFVGWDEDGDGTVDYPLGGEMPVCRGDMTLTAVYSPKQFAITIYDNIGNSQLYTLDYGSAYPEILKTKPLAPENTDDVIYTSVAWKKTYSVNGQLMFNFWYGEDEYNTCVVCEDMSFYPIVNVSYEITFDANGGSYADGQTTVTNVMRVVEDKRYYTMTELVNVQAFTKAEDANGKYLLAGWDVDGDGAADYTAYAAFVASKPLALKAVWAESKNVYAVTVTYKNSDGSVYTSRDTGDYAWYNSYLEKCRATVPDPQTTLAEQWNYASAIVIENEEFRSANVRYPEIITEKTYNVTADPDNGTAAAIKAYKYDSYVSMMNCFDVYLSKEDEKYVYKLVGWDFDGDGAADIGTYTWFNLKSDVSAKAVWGILRSKTRYVNVYANSGYFSSGEYIKQVSGFEGEEVSLTLETPVAPKGMKFIGWSESLPATFGKSDVHIFALYERLPLTFTFCVDNLLTGERSTYAVVNLRYGDWFNAADIPSVPEWAKGYKCQTVGDHGRYYDIQASQNLVIVTYASPVYVYYTVDGVITEKVHSLIGGKITLPENLDGKTPWNAEEVAVSNGAFTMPDHNVIVSCNTPESGELYVSKNGKTDTFDTLNLTDNSAIDGYTYEKESGIILISADGFTLSGNAFDVSVIIAGGVSDVTLDNLTIIADKYRTSGSSGSLSSVYNYNLAGVTALYSPSQTNALTINVSGDVSIIKYAGVMDNGEENHENCYAFCFAPMMGGGLMSGLNSEPQNVAALMSYGEPVFNVVGADNSALNLSAPTSASYTFYGTTKFKNIKLYATAQHTVINSEKAISFENCSVTIAPPANYSDNTYWAIYSLSDVSFKDCALDIDGEICSGYYYTSDDGYALSFKGNTTGKITSSMANRAPVRVYSGKLRFDLNVGCALEFINFASDSGAFECNYVDALDLVGTDWNAPADAYLYDTYETGGGSDANYTPCVGSGEKRQLIRAITFTGKE